MASFLQLAHHCFFLVSSTACCFSASICFFTSATNRSRSCSRLCLISAIVSSAFTPEPNENHSFIGSPVECWLWFGSRETYRDCASSPTALADAAIEASQSLSATAESVALIKLKSNIQHETMNCASTHFRIYLCYCVSCCVLGKVAVDFRHCPFDRLHDLHRKMRVG